MIRVLALILGCYSTFITACECPPKVLNIDLLKSYDIIFKGKIIAVKNKPGAYKEAVFEVSDLFKGLSSDHVKVLIDTVSDCSKPVLRGQIWLIYSNYKQWQRPLLNWCSRSRKWFENENEDFYAFANGISFEDEITFLKSKLGRQRIISSTEAENTGERNVLPKPYMLLILIGISSVGLILLNVVLKRFLK